MYAEYPEHRIAIVGGACSGKSLSWDVLRYEQYKIPIWTDYAMGFLDQDYWDAMDDSYIREDKGADLLDDPNFAPVHFIPEAWNKYQFIAEVLINVIVKNEPLDQQEWMLTINLNDDDYYLEPYSSNDLIRDLGLEALQAIDTPEQMREIFQRDLLRIQIASELKLPNAWMLTRPHASVVDGGMLYNLAYWPDMPFDTLAPVFRENNLPCSSIEDALGFYNGILLLETIAVLTEDKYAKYFFDGRRLDSPQHAVQVHERLAEVVQHHPHHVIIKAEESEGNKIKALEQLIQAVVR